MAQKKKSFHMDKRERMRTGKKERNPGTERTEKMQEKKNSVRKSREGGGRKKETMGNQSAGGRMRVVCLKKEAVAESPMKFAKMEGCFKTKRERQSRKKMGENRSHTDFKRGKKIITVHFKGHGWWGGSDQKRKNKKAWEGGGTITPKKKATKGRRKH